MTNIFEAFVAHTQSYKIEIQCAMAGMPSAPIVLIGEYPSESEVAFNKPFTGASGKELWANLRAVGIGQHQCYTTTLVKRRVTSKTPVNHVEFTLWKEALEYELSLLDGPRVIVALGDSVLTALTGFEGITQYRGSVYDYKGIPLVIATNPSKLFQRPENTVVFAMDMHRVGEVFRGEYKPHHVTKLINPTFEAAMDYLHAAQKHKRFAVDIETLGQETACIGIAFDPYEAMCINLRTKDELSFTAFQEYTLLRKFLEITDDVTTTVIAQNGNFDSYFMGFKDHARFRVNFDTLLAHHTLYPRLPHNLGFLTAQYTHHPYYKDELASFKEGGNIDQFWEYNATDAAITYAIAEKEAKELREQKLYDFFIEHVMGSHPNLTQATVDGIAVNLDVRQQLLQSLTTDVTAHYYKFQETVRNATNDREIVVNPASPQQLANLFYDRLNCQSTSRSTAAPIRDNWLKDPRVGADTRDVIIALNRYAEEAKFLSTYVDTKLDSDNRFRSEYKQYGVSQAPGRLSSAQTLWGSGGNAQNLPHRAYEMFEADEGCVFIYFDLAQAEARYVGWDANIEKWKQDFERARLEGGFDAHRSLAADMFNMAYDDVPKEDQDENGNFTLRYIAKRCRHGLNYRMHAARLAQTTGLSYGMASRNYYAYHRTNPELQVWWKKLESTVRKSKILYNSFGRRLLITERLEDEGALDSIVAFRPQSTIGDKVVRVWRQCHADPRWDKSRGRIAINIHDALWGIATPSFAETALSLMKGYAEEPIMVTSIVTNKTEPMIIPADLKISDTTNGQRLSMANMRKIKLEAAKI